LWIQQHPEHQRYALACVACLEIPSKRIPKKNDGVSATLFATLVGHDKYMPPGNNVIWKPPSKVTRPSCEVPFQQTLVPPREVEFIP